MLQMLQMLQMLRFLRQLDDHRQWFKAHKGLEARETERGVSFCTHAIATPDSPFIIPNALTDPRFRQKCVRCCRLIQLACVSPLVTGSPDIRFYAGFPLVLEASWPLLFLQLNGMGVLGDGCVSCVQGYGPMGTLCVIDRKPRNLSQFQFNALKVISEQARSVFSVN